MEELATRFDRKLDHSLGWGNFYNPSTCTLEAIVKHPRLVNFALSMRQIKKGNKRWKASAHRRKHWKQTVSAIANMSISDIRKISKKYTVLSSSKNASVKDITIAEVYAAFLKCYDEKLALIEHMSNGNGL